MKKWFLSTMFSVVAVLGCTIESDASGLFRRKGGCEPASYGAAAAAPCTSGPAVAPCESSAPAVEYVEQKVTRYRQVMVEKDVEEVIRKHVPRQEKYTYDVQVPRTIEEKRKITENKVVSKEVEYSYTVIVPVITPESASGPCIARSAKRWNIPTPSRSPSLFRKTNRDLLHQRQQGSRI